MRRVVVTGLGAITPLGVGVERTWTRLVAGESGLRSVIGLEPKDRWNELTSTVAGIVPKEHEPNGWRAADWVSPPDQRRQSLFAQYAIAASDMALKDAGWEPKKLEDLEATGVCIGSGIGNLDEVYNTSVDHHRDVGIQSIDMMGHLLTCI